MEKKHRIIIFFCFCITLRLFLVYLAHRLSNTQYIKIMAIFAILVSIGLTYQFIFNPHKLGGFGGDSWWNNYRPIHAIIYLTFAIMVFTLPKYAYMILLADIILGACFFANNYFINV